PFSSMYQPSERENKKKKTAHPGKIPAGTGRKLLSNMLAACLRRHSEQERDGQRKENRYLKKGGKGSRRQTVNGHGKAEKSRFLHGQNPVSVLIRLRRISIDA